MTGRKKEMRDWAAELEAGKRDDDLLSLAGRLEESRFEDGGAPSLEFRRQLRRDLLNQYAATAPKAPSRLWRLASGAAVVALLAFLSLATWVALSGTGRIVPGGAAVGGTVMPAEAGPSGGLAGPTATPLPVQAVELLDKILGGHSDDRTGVTQIIVTMRWDLPAEAGDTRAFVHLVDASGRVVAQADGLAETAPAETVLAVELPAASEPWSYEVVAGLYDATTGEQLPVVFDGQTALQATMGTVGSGTPETGPDGETADSVTAGDDAVDTLAVTAVEPASGATLNGREPLRFQVTLDYALASLPAGVVEVKVVELLPDGGRGVGTGTAGVAQGSGTVTVEVVVNPAADLAGLADLGLQLQIKPDKASAPVLIELPEAYRWRYEP